MLRSRSIQIRWLFIIVLIGSALWVGITATHGQDHSSPRLTKTVVSQPAATKTKSTPSLAGAQVIMQEGFEGAWPTGKWSVENLNPSNTIGWAKRYCPPHTGLYGETVALNPYGGGAGCLTNHPNNASVAAIYGPFDLSTSSAASVTFYLYGRTSTAKDAYNNPLDSLFVGSAVDGKNFSGAAFFGDHTNGPDGNGYWRETFDLTDRLGQSQVWVTFWFESDASGSDIGFTIDDVEITTTAGSPPPAPTDPSAPPPTAASRVYLPNVVGPVSSRIVFLHHETTTRYWISTMNTDGSDVQRIVSCQPEHLAGTNVQSCGQTWSPDGTRIAFHSLMPGDASLHLYIVNADGSNLQRLTSDDLSNDGFPVWSPDGRKIAFIRNSAGDWLLTGSIYTINVDGTGLTRVTTDGRFGPIDWSPDGKRIAYSCVIPERVNTGLCTIRSDGQNRFIVADNTSTTEMGPSWSPDGQRIAYVDAPNGAITKRPEIRIPLNAGDLHIINADGTNDTILVQDVAESRGGAWSPDGQEIVFAYRFGQQPAMARERSDLFTIQVDGTHAGRRLTNYDGISAEQKLFDIDPDW